MMLPDLSAPYRLNLPETKYDRFNKAISWIHQVRNNPWFKSQMPVTLKHLAESIKLGFRDLLSYIRGRYDTPSVTERLLELSEKVRLREVVFVEGHGAYFLPYCPPKYSWPMIKRTWDSEDWHLTSTCMNCGNNQYLPADMNTDDYALCYHCIPLNQYAAYGATPQEGSLIAYALDTMGILEDIRLLHEKPKKEKPIKVEVPKKNKPGPKPKPKKRGRKPKKKRNGWAI